MQSFVLKYNDITIDSKSLLSEWQHLIDTNFCKSSILRQIDFGWFFINMTKIFYLRKAGLYQWIFELFNKGYLSGFPTLSIHNLSFFLAETFHVKLSAKKVVIFRMYIIWVLKNINWTSWQHWKRVMVIYYFVGGICH